MKIIYNKFKKVADFCYTLFKIAELPLHFSKFSNKIYSNFQKLFLLVYKQYRKFTYEELLTDISDNLTLRIYIGLNKIMDYTTLIKFGKKLPNMILDKLVIAFKKLIPVPRKVAIDSTGISLDNASTHYCKRLGLSYKKRPFMKTSFIVDIEQYIILLYKAKKSRRHDLKDAKPLVKKMSKHYKPRVFYADRAYDDEKLFKQVFEQLGAYPLILQKRLDIPKRRRHGTYRKITYSKFDYGQYLERNKIETCNAIFKKRFGSNIKSRNDKCQKIEIAMRIIAHNIDRLIKKAESVILIFIRITRVSY
jgi:transposase